MDPRVRLPPYCPYVDLFPFVVLNEFSALVAMLKLACGYYWCFVLWSISPSTAADVFLWLFVHVLCTVSQRLVDDCVL